MLALRRFAVAPRAAARFYSVRPEGSVASVPGLQVKKEKAHEDQYVREHEAAQIRKLKESIANKKAELDKLEAEHAKLESEKKQ
ncbi:hypothetical protein BKA70DRAFT_822621 [Coprinopsis sp. MPI-PUGE-AT-0042]|nr:hypothetical protein BKA70DRAFT_822621 [Coprinopsis sp. MPI-PUGE-AT-0042]